MSENFFYTVKSPLDAIPTGRQMRTANFAWLPGPGSQARRRSATDPRAPWCASAVDSRSGLVHRLPVPGRRFGALQHRVQRSVVRTAVSSAAEPGRVRMCHGLCRAASNFRDAIKGFIEYIPVIHSPVPVLELVEGQETAELRWTVGADLGSNDQANLQAALLDVSRPAAARRTRVSSKLYQSRRRCAREGHRGNREHAWLPVPQSRHDECHCVPDGDARSTRLERESPAVHAAGRLPRSSQSRVRAGRSWNACRITFEGRSRQDPVPSNTARRSSARRYAHCNRSSANTP